ncbi:MAG: toxin-antitoxin system HicB family antitoxin [Acidobacteriota bacterium]
MNNYSCQLAWSEEDEGYVATCQEFPGLSAFGRTAQEALTEAEIALELMVETYEEEGVHLPEPIARTPYSGQFRVRIPKTLHRQLASLAQTEETSLNQLVVATLAERVGVARGTTQANRAWRYALRYLREVVLPSKSNPAPTVRRKLGSPGVFTSKGETSGTQEGSYVH